MVFYFVTFCEWHASIKTSFITRRTRENVNYYVQLKNNKTNKTMCCHYIN